MRSARAAASAALACCCACLLQLQGAQGGIATHFALRSGSGAGLQALLSAGHRRRRADDDTISLHFLVGSDAFEFPVLRRVKGSFAPNAIITTSDGTTAPLESSSFPTTYQSPNHDASVTFVGESARVRRRAVRRP